MADFDLSFQVNVKGVFHDLQLAWQDLTDSQPEVVRRCGGRRGRGAG